MLKEADNPGDFLPVFFFRSISLSAPRRNVLLVARRLRRFNQPRLPRLGYYLLNSINTHLTPAPPRIGVNKLLLLIGRLGQTIAFA